MADYTYRGTAITGTSTSGKTFPESKIARARYGQTYLNTSTGHVYRCVDEGKDTTKTEKGKTTVIVAKGTPTKAKWAYVRTDIIGAPTGKVSSLGTPTRAANSLAAKTSWKVPSSLTDSKEGKRATKLSIEHEIAIASGKKTVKCGYLKEAGTGATSHNVNLNSLPTNYYVNSGFVYESRYTRAHFYPKTKLKLKSYTVSVCASNGKGEGPRASGTLTFKKPGKPKLAVLSHDEGTGRVTCGITPAKDEGAKERYDTEWQRTVFDSRTGKKAEKSGSSTSDSAFSVVYDVTDRQGLTFDQYVSVTVRARSRGYAGASDWVEKSHVVAYPALPTITSVNVPSTGGTDKVTVNIKTNSAVEHPVTGVRLQVLKDSDAKTAAQASASDEWADTASADDGKCIALAAYIADLAPDAGKSTWLRVKSWNDFEDMFCRFSEPKRLTKLETPLPTAEDDEVDIVSTVSGADGASVTVTLGWDADGEDDSDHTELSWSNDPGAWDSTERPETFEIDDKTWDRGPLAAGGKTYRKSAVVTVKGLAEGEPCSFRARRFQEADGVKSYGAYSSPKVETPVSSPTSVVLSAPAYVPRGQAARFAWAFDSTSMQRSWRLMRQAGATRSNADKVVKRGDDPLGSCSASWEEVEAAVLEDGSLPLYVVVSTGGAEVASETVPCRVADPPSLALAAPAALAAQPLALSAVSDSPNASLTVAVTARGVTGDGPSGAVTQAEGETVWSDVLDPEWEYDDESSAYKATVIAPPGLAFHDLGVYDISITATDPETGLQSDEAVAFFPVLWSHQAPTPPDGISVEPSDLTDDTGFRTLTARVALAAPEGAAETDVYDLYRVTRDGADLIASGLALDGGITDPYAPFGDANLRYRVALRTADGDVEWRDYGYDLPAFQARFDWAGKYVELDYDLSNEDSFEKDAVVNTHLDGSRAAGFNPGVSREGRISGLTVDVESHEQSELLSELGRYPGTALVRLPRGIAYEAVVNVPSIGGALASPLTRVSVKTEQCDLSGAFAAPADAGEGE